MEKTKFTVWADRDALQAAKEYAQVHGTTLTSLVGEFLRSLGKDIDIANPTPVLDELAGSLNQKASPDEYLEYLEGKYLGKRSEP